MTDPIRPTDDAARALARDLATTARIASLGVLDPETGAPSVSRIAMAWLGGPVTLVSKLSDHTTAMSQNGQVSLLLGEASPRGDPLNQPRLTVQADAMIEARPAAHSEHRDPWLALHPKSKLYIDFGDFRFVRFAVKRASLNGGFGKAFRLTADDLGP